MANILIFRELDGRTLAYRESQHTPDYEGRTDVLVNPEIGGINLRFSKVVGGVLVNMSQAEIDAETVQFELDHADELRERNYPPLPKIIDVIIRELRNLHQTGQIVLSQETINAYLAWKAINDRYPKQ